MSKYLLTGGSGTLGKELKKYLDCFAPSSEELNITTFNDECIDEHTPFGRTHRFTALHEYNELKDTDTIIHCAAWTNVPGAEIDQASAVFHNIEGTMNVSRYARSKKWKFIYISTDYVYPGHVGNYKETDKTEPFNFYGFTKLAGEAYADPNTDLIVRTSFKPNDLWETKYNKAFIDIYTSADYVDVIAQDIAFAIHSNLTGIYNVGTERKAIYELAKKRYPNVGEMTRWEVMTSIKLPTDISMNVGKYKSFKENNIKKFNKFISGGTNV